MTHLEKGLLGDRRITFSENLYKEPSGYEYTKRLLGCAVRRIGEDEELYIKNAVNIMEMFHLLTFTLSDGSSILAKDLEYYTNDETDEVETYSERLSSIRTDIMLDKQAVRLIDYVPRLRVGYDVEEAKALRDMLAKETKSYTDHAKESFKTIKNSLLKVLVRIETNKGETNAALAITKLLESDIEFIEQFPYVKKDGFQYNLVFNYEFVKLKIGNSSYSMIDNSLTYIYNNKVLTAAEFIKMHQSGEIK